MTAATFPAMAQQGQQQMPMMGQGGMMGGQGMHSARASPPERGWWRKDFARFVSQTGHAVARQ